MNVIGKLKEQRRRGKRENESFKKLPVIPDSRVKGIGGLPVELWSLVIEFMVTDQLGDPRLPCSELSSVLDSRLVCRVFDREIQHWLHQRIRLAQIPHLAIMRTLIRQSYVQDDWPTFHTSLFASAVCNSASASSSKRRPSRLEIPRIAERIQNCTTIAMHLDLQSNSPDKHPAFSTLPRELMQRLCTAASTSIYCQEYIYMPSYYEQLFQTHAEGDACLESALLVACGYEFAEVVKAMVKLVELGELKPYPKGKYEWEVRRERRWGDGRRGRTYGRSDFSFLGGGVSLW